MGKNIKVHIQDIADNPLHRILKNLNKIEIYEDENIKTDFVINHKVDDNLYDLLGIIEGEFNTLLAYRDFAEELSAILEYALDGIEAVDIYGNIKYVNPAFLKIANIKREERKNQNIFEKNPNGLLAKVLSEGKPYYRVTTEAPGSGREVIASATPIYKNNEMTGAVIVVSDISETIKIAKELEKSQMFLENLYDHIKGSKQTFDVIVGESPILKDTIEVAKQYASSNSNVLILGESGTGKELFARAIHDYSHVKGAFISVNCAAIPQHLMESELFGHEKGAFTGADKRRIGMFEMAENGTIFLDEIGDMDYSLQGKLLRALQEKEFRRVGGNNIIKTNARVIAATNRPLEKMVKEENKFREDLYYRLNVLQLRLPPLRERLDDIPHLVNYFVEKYNRKLGKCVKEVDSEFLNTLKNHSWPGNIRELENIVERVMNVNLTSTLQKESLILPFNFTPKEKCFDERLTTISEMEKMMIQKAITIYGDTFEGKRKAAEHLGISIAKLYNKLKEINKNTE